MSNPRAIGFVNDNLELADVVIRLPNKTAIERALLENVPEVAARKSLRDASDTVGVNYRTELDQLEGTRFIQRATRFMKDNSLHALFVDGLPIESLPPIANELIDRAIESAIDNSSGKIQL